MCYEVISELFPSLIFLLQAVMIVSKKYLYLKGRKICMGTNAGEVSKSSRLEQVAQRGAAYGRSGARAWHGYEYEYEYEYGYDCVYDNEL